MDEIGVFRLRYVGARFNGRRLPVDVVGDLPAFRELVVAFARVEWYRQNANRKRLPKGFDSSLSLDLVGIEDGSAIPVLKWNRETTAALFPGFSSQLEDVIAAAFERVVLLFREADVGKYPTSMRPAQIAALNKLGANLRGEERIEFQARNNNVGEPAFVDQRVRKALISGLRDRYSAQIEDIGMLRGCVVSKEATEGTGHIVVQTDSHGEFTIPLDDETIRAEFDGNIGQPIEINVQAALNRQGGIANVSEVRSVSLIDEQIAARLDRCRERLDQVAKLSDGWQDGTGSAPTGAAIASAKRLLNLRFALSDLYKIYPSFEGGVLFEFATKRWDLSVEFHHDGAVHMFGVEIDGSGEIETPVFIVVEGQFLAEFDKQVR